MVYSSVQAFAPATMANLGVGFDILGWALEEPGDIVHVELSDTGAVEIVDIRGDAGKLPRAAERNTAGIAAASVLRLTGAVHGVRLSLDKGLPLASGLGSSAASAAAAAVAVNRLLGEPLGAEGILSAALDGEAFVSGRHADNIAPALFGGLTLVSGLDMNAIRQLPIPSGLHLALVTPAVEVQTAVARAALPRQISLRDMVHQTGQVARLIDALYREDLESMAQAMESDTVVEPARIHLMPHLADMRQLAKQGGALGLVISGAGPTLCALCESGASAQQVSEQLVAGYVARGIDAQRVVTRVSKQGARILATDLNF